MEVGSTPPCLQGGIGMMKFFYLLFTFVPVTVADPLVNEALCPNRTWDPTMDSSWNRCVYFCRNGNGWVMGFFFNGTQCWYSDDIDGTCFDGYCYKTPPTGVDIRPPKVSKEVTTTENVPENTLNTQPTTTTEGPTATQKKKKKKKKEKKQKEEDEKTNDEKKKKKRKKKKENNEEKIVPQDW
ncbi:uncharacterized protein [Dermacentor andersoni]|uniref:uncharacterized protein n=1 Tax=Dermacentor andersoni TaxID=34620 RepID=UPI003B3BDCD9